MKVSWQNGVLINECLAVDCSKGNESIVSHAHSDHARYSKKGSVFSSKETMQFLKSNGKNCKAKAVGFEKKFQSNGFEISLHNAGHVLGSAQTLVNGSETIAITSDFKFQDSLLLKAAQPLDCNTLVIETTFGLPEFSFPDRETLYEEFSVWAKKQLSLNRLVVLSGYALGKAQELTSFSNEFLGIAPIVHDKIYENNKIYEENGVNLGDYYKLDHNLTDSNVLIMPPSLCNAPLLQAIGYCAKKKIASAKASGWHYKGCFDIVFPLSDHADFSQLTEYVKQAEPKRVLTMHGYAKEFASFVKRRLGIKARSLHSDSQLFLEDFE